MKILWLTWKDRKNPAAGGAETVNEELAKRLARDGHQVLFLVAGFDGAKKEEQKGGFKIIRLGNRWTVYWKVFLYYKKNLTGWADLVIDEINTIPFFARLYAKEKNILFIHQLCREIWFYEMFFPVSAIGYFLEPVYLKMLSGAKAITISESTKKDLMRFGFIPDNVKIISEGIEIEPIKDQSFLKFEKPTILAFGAVRAMKRTDHIIRAFEISKEKIRDLQLFIAGEVKGGYGKKILKMIKKSKFKDSIECLGKVPGEKKIELMRKSHLLCVTSVKEGWGLVVTEANSQETPAIVYNVDGLRDSVKNNITGIVCRQNTPENLAENILQLLRDKGKYDLLRKNALQWSNEINFEKSYNEFKKIIRRYG